MNIRYGNIFPLKGVIVGYLLLIGSIAIFSYSTWTALLFLVIGLGIITASEGTDIDLDQKKYREYNEFYWIKTGEWSAYDHIEKIFINSIILSSTSNQSTFWNYYTGPSTQQLFSSSGGIEYKTFIKFNNGKKIAIKCEKNKEELKRELLKIARKLNTIIVDQTEIIP